MRPIWKTASVLGLLGLGYILGASGTLTPKPLGAQAAPAEGGPSEESRKKLQEAFVAIKAAAETLIAPFGVPLVATAAAPPPGPTDMRHNPDLDAVFGM